MHRKLARTGKALALAGLLGSGVALAQPVPVSPPGYLPPGEAPPVSTGSAPELAPSGGELHVFVVEAARAREWAMIIELELLADSVTFPYALKPQANAKGMELTGLVPNTLVRDRALTLARKVCPLQVVDGLAVKANIAIPLPGQTAPEFGQKVRERLTRINAEQAEALEIKTSGLGHVALAGWAGSFEEKLEFSRCLRGLTGCTSVQNDLGVLTADALVPAASAMASPPRVTVSKAPYAPPAAEVTPVPAPLPPIQDLPRAVVTTMPPYGDAEAVRSVTARMPVDHALVAGDAGAPLPPPPITPAPGTLNREIAEQEGTVPSGTEVTPASTSRPVQPAASGTVRPTRVMPGSLMSKKQPVTGTTTKSVKESPLATPAAVPVPSQRAQIAMRAKIRTALGAKDVGLSFDGKGGLKLALKMPKDTDVTRALNQVMALPELSGYQLSIEFDLK